MRGRVLSLSCTKVLQKCMALLPRSEYCISFIILRSKKKSPRQSSQNKLATCLCNSISNETNNQTNDSSLISPAPPPWHRQIALAISPSRRLKTNSQHTTVPNTHSQQGHSRKQTGASAASKSLEYHHQNQTPNGSSRHIYTCPRTTAAN